MWKNPREINEISKRLKSFGARVSRKTRTYFANELDHWFETLPFPLASILRAWQATPGDDFKTKHEHLLHFFEAKAEFVSLVFLSAFSSKPSFFDEHKEEEFGLFLITSASVRSSPESSRMQLRRSNS
jgi:hypothetical protein